MKKLLLFISIAFTAYSTSAHIIKFNEESIRQYEFQVKYHAVNQLLKQAYNGKIKLLDELNQPLNLKLKADTLWMGAIRYSFEADEYYNKFIIKQDKFLRTSDVKVVKSVGKKWLNEEDLSEIKQDDKYINFIFHAGSIWLDKKNELEVKVKRDDLQKLVGSEGMSRLLAEVDFFKIYKTLYNAAYNKTDVISYTGSDLKTALNETVLGETYYKPDIKTLMHDDSYPDDPFMLIDTSLNKKVILLIDTEKQGVVGFTIDSIHEVWFKKEEAQLAAVNLFVNKYYGNKKAGYNLPFITYNNLTKAATAAKIDSFSFDVYSYSKNLTDINEFEIANCLADTFFRSSTSQYFNPFLVNDATKRWWNYDVYLFYCPFVVQMQDPWYPYDPYMLIDTTIIAPIPLHTIKFLEADGELFSIGFEGGFKKCYYCVMNELAMKNNKITDTAFYYNYDNSVYEGVLTKEPLNKLDINCDVNYVKGTSWFRADQLNAIFTKEQVALIMKMYQTAKNQ